MNSRIISILSEIDIDIDIQYRYWAPLSLWRQPPSTQPYQRQQRAASSSDPEWVPHHSGTELGWPSCLMYAGSAAEFLIKDNQTSGREHIFLVSNCGFGLRDVDDTLRSSLHWCKGVFDHCTVSNSPRNLIRASSGAKSHEIKPRSVSSNRPCKRASTRTSSDIVANPSHHPSVG